MFPIAGQTARPIGLKFFVNFLECLRLKKIEFFLKNFIFFHYFYFSTGNTEYVYVIINPLQFFSINLFSVKKILILQVICLSFFLKNLKLILLLIKNLTQFLNKLVFKIQGEKIKQNLLKKLLL